MLGGIRGPLYQQRAIHRRAVLIRKHHRPRGITSILQPFAFSYCSIGPAYSQQRSSPAFQLPAQAR
jgi:hypothetical protein